jgi:small-conductance mechanosensitive channel
MTEFPILLAAPTGALQLPDPERISPSLRTIGRWVAEDPVRALVLIAVAIGFYFLFVLLRSALRHLIDRFARAGSWHDLLARTVRATRSFFLVVVAARIVTESAAVPDPLVRLVAFLFTVTTVVQVAIWAQTVLVGLVNLRSDRAEDDSALNLVKTLITVAVWVLAFLTLLSNLGVNITGLIAGLGIGGIAIGLAAQGVLGDLFAAFSILLDKPFRRGDTILYEPGAIGTVEEIGMKSTRIRALSGELVVVGNAKLLGATLSNYADYTRRRVVLNFGLIYETEADRLHRVPAIVEAAVADVALASFDRCHLIGFGASSLSYELVFIVDHPGLVEMFTARQAVILRMIEAFRAEGLRIAYPVQVGMIAGPDGIVVDPALAAAAGAGNPRPPAGAAQKR